ncbi:MAG: hypothetical protein JWN70_5691 [Planctomycetaceae bacterium]|nr:hypothetical protein [Planctomycetaceae bacterium]
MAKEEKEEKQPNEKIVIHIDHKQYKPEKASMTGTEIRLLAEPHIDQGYNLWLEVPGQGDDELVDDTRVVVLHNGMHFYSVLKQINPGATDGIA